MKTCYKNDFLNAWGIVKNAPRGFNVREPMLEGFCKFCLSKENPIMAELEGENELKATQDNQSI